MKNLDLSLAIRTTRDIYNRCRFDSLTGVYAKKKKSDGSTVTDIDPLVEHIVLEHLFKVIPEADAAVVREEASTESDPIEEIKKQKYLVTVDGIDGTGDFIRHFNRDESNPKWLVGMTAVYKRKKDGTFRPKFAFALQPSEKRLFVFAKKKSLLVADPLGNAKLYPLHVENVSDSPMNGSIDVFLDKPECHWELRPHSVKYQTGPSGFNTASLAAASAPFEAHAGSSKINFTTFHYKLWDFGLWPVLKGAGFNTAQKGVNGLNAVTSLDLNWFGDDDKPPGKCNDTPLVISNVEDFDPLLVGANA